MGSVQRKVAFAVLFTVSAIGVSCGTNSHDSSFQPQAPAPDPARTQGLFVSVYCGTDLIPRYLEVVKDADANGRAHQTMSSGRDRLHDLWSHADRLFGEQGATDADMREIDRIAAQDLKTKTHFLAQVRKQANDHCPALISGGDARGMISALGTLFLNHRADLAGDGSSRAGI